MVEKIREHASISVEEAKEVLERNSWDILDAMVELERAGKINGGVETSSRTREPEYEAVSPTVSGKEAERARRERNRQAFKEKVRNIVRVLIDNKIVIKNKEGELLLRLPVIVLIICAIAAIWLTVIVLAAGLIFGFRYSIEGKELGKKSVNDGINKVSDYTQNLVNSITGKGSSEGEDTNKK